jgi:hypothetical protein
VTSAKYTETNRKRKSTEEATQNDEERGENN